MSEKGFIGGLKEKAAAFGAKREGKKSMADYTQAFEEALKDPNGKAEAIKLYNETRQSIDEKMKQSAEGLSAAKKAEVEAEMEEDTELAGMAERLQVMYKEAESKWGAGWQFEDPAGDERRQRLEAKKAIEGAQTAKSIEDVRGKIANL